MEGREEDCENTIEDPDGHIIYIDVDYQNRRCYYTLHKSGDYYTKVVVEFSGKEKRIGKVITAYLPEEVKPGEKPEWPT